MAIGARPCVGAAVRATVGASGRRFSAAVILHIRAVGEPFDGGSGTSSGNGCNSCIGVPGPNYNGAVVRIGLMMVVR